MSLIKKVRIVYFRNTPTRSRRLRI